MFFASCYRSLQPQNGEIIVSWELLSNTHRDEPAVKAAFTIENHSRIMLNDDNWELYFNQSARTMRNGCDSTSALVERISGDWYRIIPKKNFLLPPGNKTTIIYECNHWLIKQSDAPHGLYFVIRQPGKEDHLIEAECNIKPFNRPEQMARHRNDQIHQPTPSHAYEENRKMSILPPDKLLPVIPSPASVIKTAKTVVLSSPLQIGYNQDLENEALYLKRILDDLLKTKVEMMQGISGQANTITLAIDTSGQAVISSESYMLEVSENSHIRITAKSNQGVFYGIQSFLALLPLDLFFQNADNFMLEVLTIKDKPRFAYRGIHIDVARNFHPPEAIYKLIDILAFYKINTLHMHLTDDEGWRLEIPGLPELTVIGGHRAHTMKNANALHPAYGSGPYTNCKRRSGSGFYTRNEFIAILQYAGRRHIRVIPEINLPGHARAAIKAMEARYEHYMMSGSELAANEYRLIDPQDTSRYLSAQLYDDNVVNIAGEGVFNFVDKVISEIAGMYAEAGQAFEIMHIGGDEVPRGAWTGSPMIRRTMSISDTIQNVANLHARFTQRILKIFLSRGLQMAGWEEIAFWQDENGDAVPNEKLAGGVVLPYVWNNLRGQQDLAYRLANRNFPVVLCHVTNFYFDLAYTNDPEEPGLYWGGFVDTRNAWFYNPFDVFSTTMKDQMGVEINPSIDFIHMERLKPEARKNILGLQAQLWSETILTQDMLEYYLLPKLTGFAESAWTTGRNWETAGNTETRRQQIDESWNAFANTLAQKELPRLSKLFGGFNYRVPPPGATIKDGALFVNTALPGLIVKYTEDGSEPTLHSVTWSEPFSVQSGVIRLKSFDAAGRNSRTITIKH